MASEIPIRLYRRGDAEAMHALDVLCFDERFRFSLRAMRRFAEASNALTWLAKKDELLAGFVLAHVERDGTYVMTLDVAPGLRRHGIADRLMACLEAAVARSPVRLVWLHAFTHNEPAIRFYEHRGYERQRLIRNHYGPGMDAWVYGKQISDIAQV